MPSMASIFYIKVLPTVCYDLSSCDVSNSDSMATNRSKIFKNSESHDYYIIQMLFSFRSKSRISRMNIKYLPVFHQYQTVF